MKVILLGDTHLGARGGDVIVAEYFNRFFSEQLYPYVKKHGIKHILQLGDLFDNRNSVNIKSYDISKAVWFDPLKELDCKMWVLLGNHDIHYRHSLQVNSPELLLEGEYTENIKVIKNPTTVDLGGYKFDIVPWICKENQDQVLEFIKHAKGNALLGHFEIKGFKMYKNNPESKDGMDRSLFEQYAFVFSGHYHHRSEQSNILYVGTPYEITWADFADPRGFHVFDTEKQTLELIENTDRLHYRINYNDGCDVDISTLADKCVKVVVQDKGNLVKYDAFIAKANDIRFKDFTVIENTTIIVDESEEESIVVDEPIEFLFKYVDKAETNQDPAKLKTYLASLHTEAMQSC